MELDTVHCGDCLPWLRGLRDACVDAVVTDPPYGTKKVAWDETVDRELFAECLRVSRGYCLFAYSNTRLWHILGELHALGVDAWTLAWHKPNAMGFERKFAPQWVPVVCAYRNGVPFWGQDLKAFPIIPHDFDHPTPKPVPLLEWLVEKACPEGGTVLDPFLGSGTTAVACVNTGRHFLAAELDPGYCDIARRRIADAKRALQPTLEV